MIISCSQNSLLAHNWFSTHFFYPFCHILKMTESEKIVVVRCLINFDNIQGWLRLFSLNLNACKVIMVSSKIWPKNIKKAFITFDLNKAFITGIQWLQQQLGQQLQWPSAAACSCLRGSSPAATVGCSCSWQSEAGGSEAGGGGWWQAAAVCAVQRPAAATVAANSLCSGGEGSRRLPALLLAACSWAGGGTVDLRRRQRWSLAL